MILKVSSGAIAMILAHSRSAFPCESCGILFGTPTRIENASRCSNVHPTPETHFEIDPAALIAAHKAMRMGGSRIAGYWHSHPSGQAAPSATDRASAAGDGRVWAIAAGDQVTFWRDATSGFEPLPYAVVAD